MGGTWEQPGAEPCGEPRLPVLVAARVQHHGPAAALRLHLRLRRGFPQAKQTGVSSKMLRSAGILVWFQLHSESEPLLPRTLMRSFSSKSDRMFSSSRFVRRL